MSNQIIRSTTTVTNTQNTKKIEFTADNSIRDCVVLRPSNLPTSLEDVKNYIRLSENGKNLPIGEVSVKFTVNVDGLDMEYSGKLAVWFSKKDLEKVDNAIKERDEANEKAKWQIEKEEAFASLTPEQLQKFINLGLLK
jgi:hypothetical protein